MSIFYEKYNLELWKFTLDWSKMFPEIDRVQKTKNWIKDMLETYGTTTNEVFDIFRINLDQTYDDIHQGKQEVFEREDVILFQHFQFQTLYPRLQDNELKTFWAKLRHIIQQSGMCAVVGKKGPEIASLIETIKEQNKGKAMEEIKKTLPTDLFLKPELQDKIFDVLFGKEEDNSDPREAFANMGPMFRAFGFVAQPEDPKKEENNKEESEEDKEEDKEDKKDDKKEETTASMAYLSRKKRLGKLRRKNKKPKAKNEFMNMVATMLEQAKNEEIVNKSELRKEMKDLLQQDDIKQMYGTFMQEVKTQGDIPKAMRKVFGENASPEMKLEIEKKMEEMKGMNMQDIQKVMMDSLRG
jgi:hypothetical protein